MIDANDCHGRATLNNAFGRTALSNLSRRLFPSGPDTSPPRILTNDVRLSSKQGSAARAERLRSAALLSL